MSTRFWLGCLSPGRDLTTPYRELLEILSAEKKRP